MLIKVGYEIAFESPAPVAMVLMLYLHPSRATKIRKAESLTLAPSLPVSEYLDAFGNRCGRVFAPTGRIVLSNDAIVEDSINLRRSKSGPTRFLSCGEVRFGETWSQKALKDFAPPTRRRLHRE